MTDAIPADGPPLELLAPPELAARWGCSVGHLANLRSARGGPNFLKLGGNVRYRLADVMAYELSHLVRCS
jgi:hypothetical protein